MRDFGTRTKLGMDKTSLIPATAKPSPSAAAGRGTHVSFVMKRSLEALALIVQPPRAGIFLCHSSRYIG